LKKAWTNTGTPWGVAVFDGDLVALRSKKREQGKTYQHPKKKAKMGCARSRRRRDQLFNHKIDIKGMTIPEGPEWHPGTRKDVVMKPPMKKWSCTAAGI